MKSSGNFTQSREDRKAETEYLDRNSVTNPSLSEPETHTDTPIGPGGAKTVFEILIVENILNRSKNPQIVFVVIQLKRVTTR